MGRTVIPIRYEVDAQLQELKRFLSALRKEDKEAIENITIDVKKHLSAITYANPLNPIELMQWCAIVELEKKLERLKHDLDRHFSGE